jgi:hypothetical protein
LGHCPGRDTAAKHGAGVVFVWVFAVDKKLEMEPYNAAVVAEPVVDAKKLVGAEEVDIEEVVIVEEIGVMVAVVVKAVEVVEAARTIPLKVASEVVLETRCLDWRRDMGPKAELSTSVQALECHK